MVHLFLTIIAFIFFCWLALYALALVSVVWWAFWGWVYTLLSDFTQWVKDRFA